MSGEHGGHGPQHLAEAAVRYLAMALALCLAVRVLAAAIIPLLPVLVVALVCAFVFSRLHL